jgi:hypothetical protein
MEAVNDPRPDETSASDLRWRDYLEDRRAQVEQFTWGVPGLAVAGQAFLLTIVLRPDTASLARLIAASAGIVAAWATLHLYAKQVYLFDLYEGAIEWDRARRELRGLQTDALRNIQIPANTTYAKRSWDSPRTWRGRA